MNERELAERMANIFKVYHAADAGDGELLSAARGNCDSIAEVFADRPDTTPDDWGADEWWGEEGTEFILEQLENAND